MQRSLIAWPEMIFIDGTYLLTDRNFVLMLALVQDSNGKSEVVATCLLARENEKSMRWFLQTFKSENEEACSKIKTVMTDKDMTERKVIREILPNVELKLCTFHVLKAFSREIGKMTTCTSKEKEKSSNLFSSLVYSETSDCYNERYLKFCKEVPKDVLLYFDKNWHPIREEWSHYAVAPESFLHFTNNILESLNGKLKNDAGTNKPLHYFFNEYFKFLRNRESEIDKAANDMFNSRLNLDVEADDPLRLYSNLLTTYAFNLVKKELEVFEYLNLQRLSSGKFIIPSNQCTYTPDLKSSNCSNWIAVGLPCCHIFAVRHKCNVDLYDPKLCLPRWTREYYKAHQRLFRTPDNVESDEKSVLESRGSELRTVQNLEQLSLNSLPDKRKIVGRPSKAFQCTLKIPKKKGKVYQEKTVEEKVKTLFLWLEVPMALIERILKKEMLIKKENLSRLGELSHSFKDEKVSIEIVKEFCDSEAFEFLSVKVSEIKSTTIQCDVCKKVIDETRFLRCDGCLLQFHLHCCNYKRKPPSNKTWLCLKCK